MMLLETDGLTRRYAGLVAVDHVNLAVPQGGIHAVIGPNGAGKTTLFNLISGLAPPSEGRIRFAGADVTRLPPYRRAALGLGRTFQNIRIFAEMSVLENVLTGLHPGLHAGLGRIITRLGGFRAEERQAVAAARDALALVGLADRAAHPAASLAYGDQRRLEIARAMAQAPKLLLLDEPAAGMNPAETTALAELVRRIAATTTVLLVEHDMGFVMALSDHITVLNFGRKIFEGPPAQVKREPAVIEAYLGARLAAKLRA
jgi:branched-chain amino acid transport system ATP-binding protein